MTDVCLVQTSVATPRTLFRVILFVFTHAYTHYSVSNFHRTSYFTCFINILSIVQLTMASKARGVVLTVKQTLDIIKKVEGGISLAQLCDECSVKKHGV